MPLALMLPLASAALLPSTNHAIKSHTASACTLTTTFSKLPAHQAARVPAISMAEAVTVPVAPAASPARPIKFIARWLARAVVLTAIAMTPMLQRAVFALASGNWGMSFPRVCRFKLRDRTNREYIL